MGASACPAPYRPRQATRAPLYGLVSRHLDAFERAYPLRFEPAFGFWRPVMRKTADAFLDCCDLRRGFARARRGDCGHDFLVSFSCKKRCFCPSCHQKRGLEFGEKMARLLAAPADLLAGDR